MKNGLLSGGADLGLLVLRMGAGAIMFFSHGLGKLGSISERFHSFSDPYGLGPEITFSVALLAEGICSLLITIGLYTRIAVLPLLVTMGTIVFVVFKDDPWNKKELPLLFFVAFLAILFAGPGKYSLDNKFFRT